MNKNSVNVAEFYIQKKDGRIEKFRPQKIEDAITASAERIAVTLTDEQKKYVCDEVFAQCDNLGLPQVPVEKVHVFVELALDDVAPRVAGSYRGYRDRMSSVNKEVREIFNEIERIQYQGDKENANRDSQLFSTQGALIRDVDLEKYYKKTFLSDKELQAIEEGVIKIHDMALRALRETNCCLFDVKTVLDGGFEMGNIFYNEPKTLDVAFDVIGDIVLSTASQQYGGFTLPQIDEVLEKYAEKSYEKYFNKYVGLGLSKEVAEATALADVEYEFTQGWQGWEYKFNTVGSSRGDYPFITVTLGLATSRFGKMASKTAFAVHMEGQGKNGKKKPVLFPKYVFLYDITLHDEGKANEDVYEAALECSNKVMYPDWLSLTGEGYVPDVYRGEINGKKFKPGTVVSPMGCRAFLSPWYKIGKLTVDANGNEIRDHFEPAEDVEDEMVAIGRYNSGAISLNLPLIYLKSQVQGQDFYDLLDEYLEMIRNLHKRTRRVLSKVKASCNPLAFCEGGYFGGNLKPNQRLEESFELMDSTTYSFGITALNELQQAFNGHSLVEEDKIMAERNANLGEDEVARIPFALEVLKHINKRANEFKHEDHMLYAIYGTPAESLCGLQIKQLRTYVRENKAVLERMYPIEKKGDEYVIPNICSSEYVTNSFHAKVTEELSGTEKQDLEKKYWDFCNGGKIQYVRYPLSYDREVVKAHVLRAMDMGFYEGVNRALNYCDDCGEERIDMGDVCPCCGSKNITKIDRMNGYLAYSRVKGDTRLNQAKMAEIAERKSM